MVCHNNGRHPCSVQDFGSLVSTVRLDMSKAKVASHVDIERYSSWNAKLGRDSHGLLEVREGNVYSVYQSPSDGATRRTSRRPVHYAKCRLGQPDLSMSS